MALNFMDKSSTHSSAQDSSGPKKSYSISTLKFIPTRFPLVLKGVLVSKHGVTVYPIIKSNSKTLLITQMRCWNTASKTLQLLQNYLNLFKEKLIRNQLLNWSMSLLNQSINKLFLVFHLTLINALILWMCLEQNKKR